MKENLYTNDMIKNVSQKINKSKYRISDISSFSTIWGCLFEATHFIGQAVLYEFRITKLYKICHIKPRSYKFSNHKLYSDACITDFTIRIYLCNIFYYLYIH